jgi:hypothetical protein
MDWIERIFGFAPDGGDGSVEFFVVVVATLGAAAVVACHPRARRAIRSFAERVKAGHAK